MHLTRRHFLKASAAFAAMMAAGCKGNQLLDFPAPERYVDPPILKDELRLVILGDWGSGQIEQSQVAQGMDAHAAQIGGYHAGLMLGDNFYPGGVDSVDDSLWREYFEEVYDTQQLGHLTWHPILGNHDYGGNVQAQIDYTRVNPRWQLPDNYWAKSFHSAAGKPLLKVIGVDTNKEFTRWDEQMAFLDAELAAARAENAPVIVFGHHPIYTCGKLGAPARVKRQMRDKMLAAGVRAYLSGHEHNAQLIVRDGLTQLIQGGGGKVLSATVWRDITPGVKFARETYGFSVLRSNSMGLRFEWRDRNGEFLFAHVL